MSSWYSANIHWLPTLCQGLLNMSFVNPHNTLIGSHTVTIIEETETSVWNESRPITTQAMLCNCRSRIWMQVWTTTLFWWSFSSLQGKSQEDGIVQIVSTPPTRIFFKTWVYVITYLLTSPSRWQKREAANINKTFQNFTILNRLEYLTDLNIQQSWLFNSI